MKKPSKMQAKADDVAPAMKTGLMAVNPVSTKAWLEIMSESTRFVMDRLQQDLDTQKAMLACNGPAELLQVQSEFFKVAMEQYTDEATRLYGMMSNATEDTIRDAQSGHSRSYDDVPL